MNNPEDAEELTTQAFEALNLGDLDKAQELASRLRDLQFSSYFEIQALIHLDRDEPESAIEVLREGVEKAPTVWLLWQLLGNTLSDAKDFDAAMNCYDTALRFDLDEEDAASLKCNRAILLGRMGHSDEALYVLNELCDILFRLPQSLQWRIEALRLRALADLGRCEEVLAFANALEEKLQAAEDADAKSKAFTWVQGGFALLSCEQNTMAHEWALQALEIDRLSSEALRLLRFSNPATPLGTRCFQVMLEGDWVQSADEDHEGSGFFTSLSVVARVAEEAETLALQMEAPRWETSLRVEECEEFSPCDETPVGVYEVNPYNIFPRVAQDEDDSS